MARPRSFAVWGFGQLLEHEPGQLFDTHAVWPKTPHLNLRVRIAIDALAALPSLLNAYIRDHLARAMGASPARIDTQQSLLNLGLDSLIAVEVRNRINADLGINVPLAKLMQSASISALAAYVAERLLVEGDRSERSKTAVRGIAAEVGIDIPVSGKDAADLLERIDELTEEGVDRHSGVLAAQGHN